METALFELVAGYGVMGIGWIAAVILYRRNVAIQDRMLQLALEIKTTLATLVERLR